MLKIVLRYFLGGIILSLIAIGCSSSSYQSRYRDKSAETQPASKAPRFSSDNDSNPESKTKTITYNDPAESNKEFDEKPIEEYKIDSKSFAKKYKYLNKLGNSLTPREKLLFEIVDYIDTPYQYGGNTHSGIDCSAFTMNVFKKAVNKKLPRTASEQFEEGSSISNFESLRFGDLIFFNTTRRAYPGHVGIYLGNYLFAHASQSQGVIISSLKSEYYKSKFVGGRRVFSFGR